MHVLSHYSFLALFALVCSCATHENGHGHMGVYARLSSPTPHVERLQQARIVAVLTNHGPTNVVVRTWFLKRGVLSVDVFNPKGERLNTVPPSIPPPISEIN